MILYRKFFLDAQGKPILGTGFGMLGVRPFDPKRPKKYHDVKAAVDMDLVKPGDGGLSAFSDPAEIKVQAVDLILCRIETGALPTDLTVVSAGDPHFHLEPRLEMVLVQYQSILASTRDDWTIV